MDQRRSDIAEACLRGAEADSMRFPQVVEALMQAGFESYAVDFRCGTATYFLPDGDHVTLPLQRHDTPVATAFDPDSLQAAIREAQQAVPGYTYAGFCGKAMAAGCAGYVVSFSGRRAVYLGRTAETHVEHFPR